MLNVEAVGGVVISVLEFQSEDQRVGVCITLLFPYTRNFA